MTLKALIKISLSLCLLVSLSCIAACQYTNPLDRLYDASRPDYGNTALPNPGPDAPPPHVDIINPDPSLNPAPTFVETAVTGTWTFTTPRTTTSFERKNANSHQFSLYFGRPAPTDTPFVVITVSPEAKPIAEADPATYKATSTRTYVLNGNIAKEWIGTTNTGAAFSEIILTKPGQKTGDLCHAIAVAKTEEQRKLALEILTSLTWTPNASK